MSLTVGRVREIKDIQKNIKIYFIFLCSFVLLFSISNVYSMDVLKVNVGDATLTMNAKYKRKLLHLAMEETTEEFGPYKLISKDRHHATNIRAFIDLKTGENLNVYFAVTSEKWEGSHIPIRVPIRKGITSYRLLLVHQDNMDRFVGISTLTELKRMVVGLESSMTTYTVMNKHNFKIVDVVDYSSIFNALQAKRFDFIPRTVNEAFEELELKGALFKDLVLVPEVALLIPSATYLFVSKQEPRIAERLKLGFKRIVENGKFSDIFNHYFLDSIERSDLSSRRIIPINDISEFDKKRSLHPELWWMPKGLARPNLDTSYAN